MNKKSFFYSLPMILLLIVVIAGWFATDYLGNLARQDIVSESQASELTLSTYLSDTFTTIEGLVKALSGSPWMAPALLSKRDKDIEHVNSALDRYNSALNASVTYLMDANGMTVASSNRNDPDSFVGKSYRFRPYFQEAAKGQPYHYFALGITSGKRGFYASYPVQNRLGKVIGVVTMKKDLDDMATFFKKYSFCFLISPDGIIFLSSKPEMVLKSLWPLDKTVQQKLIASQQFGNKLSGAVTKKEIADGMEVTLEGKDYFVSRKVIDSGGWSIVLMTATDRIWIYKLTGILTTIFVCFLIMIFSGILYLTDRSREAIRRSEEKFRTLAESSPFAILMHQGDYWIYANRATVEISGYTEEELYNMRFWDFVHPDHKNMGKQIGLDRQQGKVVPRAYELKIITKSGAEKWVSLTGNPIQYEDKPTALISATDITERKLAEEALRESEEKFRLLSDQSLLAIGLFQGGLFKYVNQAYCDITGYTFDEIMKWRPDEYAKIIHPDDRAFVMDQAEKKQSGNPDVVTQYQFKGLTKNQETKWVDLYSKTVQYKGMSADLLSFIDITERKLAEDSLKNSETKYRNIFENAMEGIYQSTIAGRFMTANAAFARMAGYDSPEELIESIKDIGTQLYVHPEDRKRFLEIRAKKGFVEDFEVEFYKKDGSTFWVVINARTVKDEQGKILYFEGLIEDITLRKHAEGQLLKSLESLKNAVGTTIHVLASAVEAKDFYTSGHQLRSADLARAIATEMGLAQEKIDGIRMAGSIHDIGKLSVPAEILSKPTKLTDIEFSLIKEHSRSGYEMLKDVESPWPLAQIVYQHHERMDGSGYPRNLKGDEILIEARILAVADVVEAMASHRPYRPALGIEAALEEIEKNKGILYDNTVADVCLKLFRKKGYQLT